MKNATCPSLEAVMNCTHGSDCATCPLTNQTCRICGSESGNKSICAECKQVQDEEWNANEEACQP